MRLMQIDAVFSRRLASSARGRAEKIKPCVDQVIVSGVKWTLDEVIMRMTERLACVTVRNARGLNKHVTHIMQCLSISVYTCTANNRHAYIGSRLLKRDRVGLNDVLSQSACDF